MNKKKLGVIAPSFGINIEPYKTRMKHSIRNLEKKFDIILGENVYKNDGPASNDALSRANEFNNMLDKADLLISAGGGEVMCEILPYIDFEKIKKNPKLFIGFSDNTFLTYTITINTDNYSIYGPNIPSFYSYPFKYDSKDTLDLINGKKIFKGYRSFDYDNNDENPLKNYIFNKRCKVIPINYKNPFKGRLIGGCLDCLEILAGTKYDNTKEYLERHKDEGIIYYLEACDLNPMGVIRALNHLKYCDYFKYIKGFVIGRPLHLYEKMFGVDMHDAVLRVLKDLNVPILLDCPIGHISPSLPIKNGGLAQITYENNNIIIEYLD